MIRVGSWNQRVQAPTSMTDGWREGLADANRGTSILDMGTRVEYLDRQCHPPDAIPLKKNIEHRQASRHKVYHAPHHSLLLRGDAHWEQSIKAISYQIKRKIDLMHNFKHQAPTLPQWQCSTKKQNSPSAVLRWATTDRSTGGDKNKAKNSSWHLTVWC